ncbi:hypothetical protein D9611_007940 [Ephemerocybe angulata]|uniref:WD40 repeat-like protein n=1 Tax=Ephemerocybe angulata TaxID=980116 RepID=A0A8H5CFJ6_9AGAR|nr:hypothetical protein D9611_007940 [Tulosesus angulatus]
MEHTIVVETDVARFDGLRIISGSDDKSVTVWDALTGTVQRTLEGHTKIVSSVTFSGDGSRIFSGSYDHSVRVWDALTGKPVQAVLEGHTYCAMTVASSGNRLQVVSGALDRSVRVWDVLTGKVLNVLNGHTGYVRSVSFSHDGSRICSASDDKTLRVWDASTSVTQSVLEGHNSAAHAAALSRDGRRIVSGSWDRTCDPLNAQEEKIKPAPRQEYLQTSLDRELTKCSEPTGSSLFDGSSNFSISELHATQSGRDINYAHTVQNITIVNQQPLSQIQTFAAGVFAGSAMTVLFGSPDHIST